MFVLICKWFSLTAAESGEQRNNKRQMVYSSLSAALDRAQPIKQATSHKISRNPRRPIVLTAAQAEVLKSNPQYIRLTEALSQVPKGP